MTKVTISSSLSIKPLLYLNLHVGLIAWGFLLSAARWQNLDPGPALSLLVFCAAVAVYGLDRFGGFSPEDRINAPERCEWLDHHPRRQRGVIGLALLGVLLTVTMVSVHTRLVGGGYALFAASYTRPLLPGRRRLQDISGLKLPCIVLGWALLPALHPELAAPEWWVYRAGWLIPNVLWSEWRDHPGDRHTPRPPPPRKISLMLMAFTLCTGLCISAGRDLAGPLLYTLGLWRWSRRDPVSFSEKQDLFLLASLVTALL